jgi:hypothetical protein
MGRDGDGAVLVIVGVTLLFGLVFGLIGGVSMERNYQCERVGGVLVGTSVCVKGHTVLQRWG